MTKRKRHLRAMDTNTSGGEMSTETEKPSARVGQLAADLMARYFDEADPEARGLYEEFREAPPAEVLERQRGGDRILPSPEVGTLNVTARSGY